MHLHSVFENKGQIYLMLEYAGGGTLEQFCRKMGTIIPPKAIKTIFK